MKLVATIVVALCASLTFVHAADGDETPAPTEKPTPLPTVAPTEKTTGCQIPDAIDGAKQLPDLPPTFQTTIESKFLKGPKKGDKDFEPHVMLVREFTDRSSHKGKRAVFVADGKDEKNKFFDLTQGDAFTFTLNDDKCDAKNYKGVDNPGELYFKFSTDAESGKVGTMLGLEDIYNFSKAHEIHQTSNKELVRGIECEKWSTCFNWEKYNKDFVVDFYWSTNTVMPQRENTPTTPVRMEVKGYDKGKTEDENSLQYHHVYDFINFQDKIEDPSVFWPEVKHLCGNHEYYESHGNQKHTFPGIKDTFSVDLEHIKDTTDKKTVMHGKYVMDSLNKLMRTDLEISAEDNSFYASKCGNAAGICKVIHDFSVGLEYIIKQDGSCSIYSIPVKNTNAGNLPRDILPDQTNTYVTIASGYHLFSVGNGTTGDHLPMEYQGQRRFREVDVDAWAARYSDDDQYREIFLRDGKLWGMIQNVKTDVWQSSRINFYNYDEAPDMSAFDIHYCFSNKDQMSEAQQETFKTIHGKLRLKEKWSDIQKIGMWKVQQKLREKLAEKAGVNPLRITDMMLSKDGKKDDSDVNFWFTILWASPISGSVWHEGTTPSAQKSVEDAEKALEKFLDDKDQDVKIDEDKKVTIKKDSLKTDDDTMKDDPRASQGNVIKTGHSNNAMAGVGISMLLLGAVIGLGVGFYMWKRRGRGVPYQIHH